MIHLSCLPVGVSTHLLTSMEKCQTIAGTFDSSRTVRLREILLLEFDKTKRICGTKAHVFDAKCNYDVILGRDVYSDIGVMLNFETNTVKWMDREIAMKPRDHWKDRENFFVSLTKDSDLNELEEEPEAFILDAKYEKQTGKEIADHQKHLSQFERQGLIKVLEKYDTLFDGTMGLYPHEKVHLDLEPDSVPVHVKPYSVPLIQEDAFKKELQHSLDIGVSQRCGPTEWASPAFIIPKKDAGRVRWISDLWELNKCLKRKVYPLPLIQDIINKRVERSFDSLAIWI
jgi:hypothetical protein